MSAVDCGRFQAELAELLGGDVPSEAREGRLAGLRAHASACEHCADALGLLNWAALSSVARDGWQAPSRDYWERFDTCLQDRIRRETLNRRRWRVAAAAALAAIALLAVRQWRDRSPAHEVAPTEPSGRNLAVIPQDATADEGALLSAFDSDAWGDFHDASDDLDSDEDPSIGPGLYPEVDRLDPESRRRLLEWLNAEETRLAGGST